MIDEMIRVAKMAASAVMQVYKDEKISQSMKSDRSPVTQADLWADEIIRQELSARYPHIPILSEEGVLFSYSQRKNWKDYFLIDPLDGTKEFLKKNDEFTINIAYVEDGVPKLGVVYAPALDLLYFNRGADEAYKEEGQKLYRLPCASKREGTFVLVTSRSHMSAQANEFLEELKCKFDDIEVIGMGSSLKLCLVAEGVADSYPRFGPTSEWDTAAAHAIVKAAGGEVYQYGTDSPLAYNKENLLNPSFEVLRIKN